MKIRMALAKYIAISVFCFGSITCNATSDGINPEFSDLTNENKSMLSNLLRSAASWAEITSGIKLDYSESSVAALEKVLEDTRNSLAKPGLDLLTERTEGACMAYGAYLGELFVKNQPAEWVKVKFANESVQLAVRSLGPKKTILLPLKRACSRITEGSEFNVIDYYMEAKRLTE